MFNPIVYIAAFAALVNERLTEMPRLRLLWRGPIQGSHPPPLAAPPAAGCDRFSATRGAAETGQLPTLRRRSKTIQCRGAPALSAGLAKLSLVLWP